MSPLLALPPGFPQPPLKGNSCGRAALRTSKSSGLQLLIPDDGGGDPQLLSNLSNLLDIFMEKQHETHEEGLSQG